jgi:hypothetical protein
MTGEAHRIFTTTFAKVYPLYVQNAERKRRARDEVDQVICWMSGYDRAGLQKRSRRGPEAFFAEAPALHPNTALIKGVVCDVRAEASTIH